MEITSEKLPLTAKKKLFFSLKIILTLVILYLIFRNIAFRDVFRLFLQIKPVILLLLVVTAVIKLFTQYLNWDNCLRINEGYCPRRSDVIKTLFIGNALRLLLPGGYATVGKVWFIEQSKRRTLVSIGLEKFMLSWSVLLFGSWAALFYFVQYSLLLRTGLIIFISLIPLLLHQGRLIFKKRVNYFDNSLKIIPLLTLSQAVYIFFTVFQYFLIINSFHCLPLYRALIIVPLILTANTIPITYSGLGLRETFSIYLFSRYGVSAELAVTASLVVFLINGILPALVGIYFIITSKRNKP